MVALVKQTLGTLRKLTAYSGDKFFGGSELRALPELFINDYGVPGKAEKNRGMDSNLTMEPADSASSVILVCEEKMVLGSL
jgi:hypothetical protein